MNDMRRNGVVGVIEQDGLQATSMHFAEWWNGEGFDVCFDDGDVIKLHLTQLQALLVMALATDFVDVDEALKQAADLLGESAYRQQRLESIRESVRREAKRDEEVNERRRNIKVIHENIEQVKD